MRRPNKFVIVVLVGAALGLLFASVSTYDFVQHLDRQVHDIHCSFAPGLAEGDSGVTSGCQVTMMSPYSSVLRTTVWGGIPISLAAMSVFAFLLFFCVDLVVSGRQDDRRATGFLLLATGLPVLASVVMATVSLVTLGAACKLCIGIYAASAICLVGAALLWRRAPKVRAVRKPQAVIVDDRPHEPNFVTGANANVVAEDEQPLEREVRGARKAVDFRYLAGAFVAGVLMVVAPAVIYLSTAPDQQRFIGSCGALADAADSYAVMVPIGANAGGVPTIEILDPLCPACRAFEHRLDTSDLGQKLDRKALLFPLDNTCNWMISEAIHPGACAVSEAVLCAGSGANEVVQWAFAKQDDIKEAATADPKAAASMVKARFPALASCIGSAKIRSKLNKSLRWAVRNQLQVLTPQLYVNGVKLCDEDVDLGMDFALSRLIKGELGATPKKPVIDNGVDRRPARPPSAVNAPPKADPPTPTPQPPTPQTPQTPQTPTATPGKIDPTAAPANVDPKATPTEPAAATPPASVDKPAAGADTKPEPSPSSDSEPTPKPAPPKADPTTDKPPQQEDKP